MTDAINISLNDAPSITIDELGPPKDDLPTVNFGPGADMLMNQNKMKSPGGSKDVKLTELDDLNDIKLDDDLNNILEKPKADPKESKKSIFENLSFNLGGSNKKSDDKPGDKSVSFGNKISSVTPGISKVDDIPLKGATAQAKTETSDGFKKFNNIPINPSKSFSSKKELSPQEKLKEKFKYLRRLEALEEKGIQLSKKYSMESSLNEMKGEYEMIKSEMEKKSSVKFQGKMLMAAVSALEFLNNKFDPFDLKLDGWSESITENLDEYDDVFGELHEKYGGKTNVAPELKLLFMIGGSGLMLHMTNTMFKSAIPGMDDIMRQNPELMRQFTSAAVNSMGEQKSGFSNFMSSMMPPPSTGKQYPPQMQPPQGSPPGPPEFMKKNPPQMPSMQSRPDIAASRSREFNDAVNLENNYETINIGKSRRQPKRAEMKGPSEGNNIKDILSGLKTKKINLKSDSGKDGGSTVSVTELKEMNATLGGSSKPKKSKRNKKSDKNVVSLNL